MTDSDRRAWSTPSVCSGSCPSGSRPTPSCRRLGIGRQLVRPPLAVPATEQRGSLSGTLATMGPGVPYAIGAKFAHPDRPAIAIVGDGAMQMNGLAELITVKRYWPEWSDPASSWRCSTTTISTR